MTLKRREEGKTGQKTHPSISSTLFPCLFLPFLTAGTERRSEIIILITKREEKRREKKEKENEKENEKKKEKKTGKKRGEKRDGTGGKKGEN